MLSSRPIMVFFASWLMALSISPLSANYWMSGAQLTACGQKAVELLEHSAEEGLDPESYHFALQAVEHAQRGGSPDAAAEALSRAMVKYVNDVRNGRFNPILSDKTIVTKRNLVNANKIVQEGISSGSCTWMSKQAPSYIEYKQLKLLYRKYAALRSKGKWPHVVTDIKIYPGSRKSQIKEVRQILGLLGDLPVRQIDKGSHYDNDLVAAVKSFQYRHALRPTGIIDPDTVREMNKTPDERIRQIRITMERWRWMPRDPGNRYIIVNIAGYHLEAVQNNKVVVSSPLIVGADYRETPVFTTMMTGVKFNPSWHVPNSLAVQDILPKLKEDPSYIKENNMLLFKKQRGKLIPVDPLSIKWSEYSQDHFPFFIIQNPGPNNPLGKIRFTTHNRYDIFLHSTPQQYQYLFDFPVRAFSAGCIRVKNVVDLAYFVLDEPHYWSKGRIAREMEGTVTQDYNLKKSIPVYLTYFTVWTDQNGVPHFMPDIYGQDQQTWAVMQKSGY